MQEFEKHQESVPSEQKRDVPPDKRHPNANRCPANPIL